MQAKNERIASIIMRNVSDIIRNDVKDPNIGFVTITDVEVTSDLSYATIYVTFLDKVDKSQYRLESLNKVKGLIRSKLAKTLSTRRCPELIFKYDDSLEKGNHIDKIIDDLNK